MHSPSRPSAAAMLATTSRSEHHREGPSRIPCWGRAALRRAWTGKICVDHAYPLGGPIRGHPQRHSKEGRSRFLSAQTVLEGFNSEITTHTSTDKIFIKGLRSDNPLTWIGRSP